MSSVTTFLLRQQHLSAGAQRNYKECLSLLERYAREHLNKNIDELDESEVIDFLSPLRAGTYNQRFQIYRKFFNKPVNEGGLGRAYFAGMKSRKVKQKYNFLDWTDEHTAWLLESALTIRDKALIAVLFECGFRRGESVSDGDNEGGLVGIRRCDVQFDPYGALITVSGKTGTRTVRAVKSAALLGQWLETHPRKATPNAPLFCHLHAIKERRVKAHLAKGQPVPAHVESPVKVGDPLTAWFLNQTIKRIATRARTLHPSLPHIHPHKARHASASKSMKSGVISTQGMEQRYGWSSSRMIDVYAHLTPGEVDEQVLRANGIQKADVPPEQVPRCPRCQTPNMPHATFCVKCGSPMDLATAQKVETHEAQASEFLQSPAFQQALAEALKHLAGTK